MKIYILLNKFLIKIHQNKTQKIEFYLKNPF
jgi:hypothetical protein